MFNDPGLNGLRSTAPDHPVVKRFELLQQLQREPTLLSDPDDEDIVREIAAMYLDHNEWPVPSASEDYWSFLPDPAKYRFVTSRIPSPALFPDVVAELHIWLKMRGSGLNAEFLESDGLPDIVIDKDEEERTYVEVKHVRDDSRSARINEIIKKANRQIRSADPKASGIVVVKVASSLTGAAYLEEVPAEVHEIFDEIKRVLHAGQNRSVAHAVVIWDTADPLGDPPNTEFIFTRRSQIISHPSPRNAASISLDSVSFGLVVTAIVHGAPSTKRRLPLSHTRSGNVVISAGFRQRLEEIGLIRASHVVGALEYSDGYLATKHDEQEWILATKRPRKAKKDFTLLVIAGRNQKNEVHPLDAFRLYDISAQDTVLASRPQIAFMELLLRYGSPIVVGDLTALYVPYYSVRGSSLSIGLPTVDDPSPNITAQGQVRYRGEIDGEHLWEVRHAYAINLGAYREALAAFA